MNIPSILSKLGLPSSAVPEGWLIRVEFENDGWLVSVVSPFGDAELVAARSVDPTLEAAVQDAIQRARKKAAGNMARCADPREIYSLSDPKHRPIGDWWWMYDACMGHWKKWERGWGYDSCWTHWSPASLTPPFTPPYYAP